MHARKAARDAFFPFAEDDVFFLPRRGDVTFRDLASARAFADRVNRRRGTKVGPELRAAAVRSMNLRGIALVTLAMTASSVAGCSSTLPPFGQARITVLTDAPIPAVFNRLRLDIYDEGGAWIDSRESAVRDPSAVPLSFTVFSGEDDARRRVRVRLRAFREGALRDYRGERYVLPPPTNTPPDAIPAEAAITDLPRLLREGGDVTPTSEPQPESAIDRLTWVAVEDGVVREITVVLRIACAGTMADMVRDRTCIDDRGVLAPTPEGAREERGISEWERRLAEDAQRLPPPRTRGLDAHGAPLFDEEIMVRGGAFVVGSRSSNARIDTMANGELGPAAQSPTPERVFVVPPLVVDRYEVTVARYRAALARGFVPPQLGLGDFVECSFTTEPLAGAASRETWPIDCITHEAARAFCQFEGGDLLPEVAWEYLATAEGRSDKSTFPWGNDVPACEHVVFGLSFIPSVPGPCNASAALAGPLAVDAGPRDETPSGVHGLAANVAEWVRDAFYPYGSACWATAPLYDPSCEASSALGFVSRGATFADEEVILPATRRPLRGAFTDLGFRCARRA